MSAAFATGKKMSDSGSQKAEIELPAETEVDVSSEPVRGRRRRRGSVGAESSVNMDELRELAAVRRQAEEMIGWLLRA